VLRPPAPDHPVGTRSEVSVNVIEIAHDIRIGSERRHHEDIARGVADRLTIYDTTIDDDILKLVVAECLQCVDQRRGKSAAGCILPVAPVTRAFVVKITNEGALIDDTIPDAVRFRVVVGVGLGTWAYSRRRPTEPRPGRAASLFALSSERSSSSSAWVDQVDAALAGGADRLDRPLRRSRPTSSRRSPKSLGQRRHGQTDPRDVRRSVVEFPSHWATHSLVHRLALRPSAPCNAAIQRRIQWRRFWESI
jgi:hypothetical protein